MQRLTSSDAKQGDGLEGKEAEQSLDSPEEETHRRAIEQEKLVYKDSFETLRNLKPEIEHIRKVK